MNQILVSLEGIGVRFGSQTILEPLNATVDSKDFIIMTGSNGDGKTTLLKIIAGLMTPYCGKMRKKKGLALGYLPQHRSIDRQFPITVRDVVKSGLQNRKSLWQRFSEKSIEDLEQIIQKLNLSEFASSPIQNLSGGQWQRTLLARAIVSHPDLLLLDEPDTHLDAESKAFLYAVLEEINQETAILLVSHDASLSLGNKRWEIHDHKLRISRK